MERTEQQKRIEAAIFDLIQKGSNRLIIRFISLSEAKGLAQKTSFTGADRRGNVVVLTLLEPSNYTKTGEFDLWADAIVDTETLLSQIEDEVSHEKNHPNFFLAVKAKYEDEVNIKSRNDPEYL